MPQIAPSRLLPAALALAVVGPAALADEGDQAQAIHLPGAKARLTLDYVSQYYFRGYEQLDSDQGVVLQPGAEMSLPVVSIEGLDVRAKIGTWGSFHSDSRGATTAPFPGWGPSNPKGWYEQRLFGSFIFDADLITTEVGLTYYTFPSQARNNDITELNIKVTLDDSRWLGEFAFNPYAALALELQNNNPALGDELSYLELGGAFSFDMTEHYGLPLVWEVPIKMGLSIEDYYVDAFPSLANETFGFVSVGLFGTIPLSELTGSRQWLGAWDLTAGVTLYFLNSRVNTQPDNRADYGDNYQFVATVGISREW